MLLKPVKQLEWTDMPEYAAEHLARSRVKRVEVVGRRGPVQMKVTSKELREMIGLEKVGVKCEVDREQLKEGLDLLAREGERVEGYRMRKRMLEMLEKVSPRSNTVVGEDKSWSLKWWLSPTSIQSSQSGEMLESITFARTSPISGDTDPSRVRVVETGEDVKVKTDLVFKSVGYKSQVLQGLESWWDPKKYIYNNINGRIIDKQGHIVCISILMCGVTFSI
jgi:adrenodoxin-NADP+ reductase